MEYLIAIFTSKISLLEAFYILMAGVSINLVLRKIILPGIHNLGLPLGEGSKPTLRQGLGLFIYLLVAIVLGGVIISKILPSPQIKELPLSCDFAKDSIYRESFENITVDYESVIEIAEESECILYGPLATKDYVCNSDRGEWWIVLDETSPTKGCKRSCVVDVYEGKATLNWQCGF